MGVTAASDGGMGVARGEAACEAAGRRRFYLGVDGGGTKVEASVGDAALNVLGRGAGGPCNYHAVGLERAARSLGDAVTAALGAAGVTAGELAGAFAGIAGVDRPADAAALQSALERLLPGVPLTVDNDGVVALAGATGGQPGVVIISGTGSIALGVDAAGHRARAGGWGYILGDEGSGYDIGRRALSAVARDADGRGPATAMRPAILGHLGLEAPGDLYRLVYLDGLKRHEVAALVPLVAEAARAGDGVARRLLAAAARDLACAAATVIAALELERAAFPVALCGGVFTAGPPLVRPLWRRIRRAAPSAHLIEALHPPVVGAMILARRLGGDAPLEGAAP